jgi:hypothetical protein
MSDIDQTYDSQADDSRYDDAKRWTYLLTGIGVAIWVWVGFVSKAQEAAVWTAMAFPFACLFVGERYAGIIKFNKKKGDPDPSIATAFFLPAIGLFFKAMQAWHVVEYTNFWESFAIAFLTIAIASVAISSEIRRNISSMFLCLVFCGFYGYGAVLDVNGMLATGPVTTYHATLNDKYLVRGKGTTYSFILSAWGPLGNGNKVNVSASEYDQHSIGDNVTIYLRVGYLGIPNFWVR